MRFRLGLLMGGAVGYYMGAKAGRERYEQLNEWLQNIRGSEVVGTAEEKTRAVLDLGVERARDLTEEKRVADMDEQATVDARRGADDPVTRL